MSQFIEAMKFRHACKVFNREKKIPQEQFDSMLDVVRMSPSSFGMEPWRVLVIRDENVRKALKNACWNQSQITDCSELVIFTTDNESIKSDSDYVRAMFNRRGLSSEAVDNYIGVYANFLANIENDEVLLENWAAKQCYIAMANMMTYAATLSIDSCPIEGFIKDEVEAILDLEFGISAAVICAFGYRAGEQTPQLRHNIEKIVKYI